MKSSARPWEIKRALSVVRKRTYEWLKGGQIVVAHRTRAAKRARIESDRVAGRPEREEDRDVKEHVWALWKRRDREAKQRCWTV